MERRKRLRFGLIGRIAAALTVVGLVPLGVVSFGLFEVNREAMRDQVKRTHTLAVRATAARLESRLEGRLDLAESLASNQLLLDSPRSAEALGVLSATLQAHEGLAAVVLLDAGGDTVVRAQFPALAGRVDAVLERAAEDPVTAVQAADGLWLLFTAGLPEGAGTLHLVDAAADLSELFTFEEIGEQAELLLLDRSGETLVATADGLRLPDRLVEQATSGKLFGAQVVALPSGDEVVAALWPLDAAPWTVVSTQPAAVAEASLARLRRQSLVAVAVALLLASIVAFAAYRSVVRPLRGVLQAQRDLGTVGAAPEGGDEISQLRASFELLRERVRRKQELGRVFLGRYQIQEILGEGSMGTVFRGWDPKLQRPVALKTIQLSEALPEGERRRLTSSLLDEAVTAARFHHPNIVSVHDAEDTPEAAYVAMELVEGETLAFFIWRRGRLEPAMAVPIAAAVARALEAAHAKGLVHRDVKPANVLLGYDGSVKVTDFGISSYLGSLRDGEEMVFGTPGYLAPEAVRGKGFTPASDLFALGVVLYQCLAGEKPFTGDSVRQEMINTVLREAPPLSSVVKSIPPVLDVLVRDLLQKEPSARPESAAEVADRLERLAAENEWSWEYPADAPPAERGEPGGEGPRGRWVPTVAVEASELEVDGVA